jgi:hypothetical protein
MEKPMITRSDFRQSSIARYLVLFCVLCALLYIASGCAFSNRAQMPRTSWEQIQGVAPALCSQD